MSISAISPTMSSYQPTQPPVSQPVPQNSVKQNAQSPQGPQQTGKAHHGHHHRGSKGMDGDASTQSSPQSSTQSSTGIAPNSGAADAVDISA